MMPLPEHLLHMRTRDRTEDGIGVHLLVLGHQQLAQLRRLSPLGKVTRLRFLGTIVVGLILVAGLDVLEMYVFAVDVLR